MFWNVLHSHFLAVNQQSDSERIAGDYEASGFTAVRLARSDEIVVNTVQFVKALKTVRKVFFTMLWFIFNEVGHRRQNFMTALHAHHGHQKLYEMLPMLMNLPINEVG